MRNPPLYVRLLDTDLRKGTVGRGYTPSYQPPAGTKTIALQPENPKANWTPEHHLAHHLQGMDFHSRNTKGGTGGAEYQQHLQGARHAVETLGADQSKLTQQHYSESAQAFPSHIRSNLGKSSPGLYVGG